ncbi:hypothetical protein NKG05_11045 [Oerskovia sp. M15]
MSADARAAATQHILARGKPDAWTVRHTTNSSYGSQRFGAPEIYFVRKFGLLPTAFGLLPPHRVLTANDAYDPRVLPVFEISDQLAKSIRLQEDHEEFRRTTGCRSRRSPTGGRFLTTTTSGVLISTRGSRAISNLSGWWSGSGVDGRLSNASTSA